MSLIDQLLQISAAYRAARGLSVARVSYLAFGDGKVLSGLANAGRDITTRRLEAAVQWFSDNWPEHATWPEQIHRPAPRSNALSANEAAE